MFIWLRFYYDAFNLLTFGENINHAPVKDEDGKF